MRRKLAHFAIAVLIGAEAHLFRCSQRADEFGEILLFLHKIIFQQSPLQICVSRISALITTLWLKLPLLAFHTPSHTLTLRRRNRVGVIIKRILIAAFVHCSVMLVHLAFKLRLLKKVYTRFIEARTFSHRPRPGPEVVDQPDYFL